MAAKLRLAGALCALVAAVIVVWQTNPAGPAAGLQAQRNPTSVAVNNVSTTIKWPVVETVDPRPFHACEDIPYDVYERLGQTIPADAVQLDIDGHRAAQYWIMKPTDWNDRWWITCMIAFKTSYGVIQQSVFYSPIYSPDAPDCLQVNMQRANELAPYYKF